MKTNTETTNTDAADSEATSTQTARHRAASARARGGRSLFRLLAVVLLASCGGAAGGGPGTDPTAPPPADIAGSLERLGVPLAGGARVGSDGTPVAADYAPFGDRTIMWRVDELFALGIPMPRAATDATFMQFDDATPGADLIMGGVTQPWTSVGSGAVRAAAAGDIDGDGREETIVVSAQPSASDTANPVGFYVTPANVDLTIIEDAKAPAPFSITSRHLLSRAGVRALSVAAADFDGDNQVDLAIALTTMQRVQSKGATTSAQYEARARTELLFAHNDHGTFTIDDGATQVLLPGDTLEGPIDATVVLQPARLDADRASELALVLNYTKQQNNAPMPSARYTILDDATTGYARLGGGPAQGSIVGAEGGEAMIGDVAAGDLDGDAQDELVFGGINQFRDDCNGGAIDGPSTVSITAIALDDVVHGLAPMGSTRFARRWGDCGSESQYDVQIRWAPVRMLNADGDDRKEVLVGDVLFDDFKAVPFHKVGELPTGAYAVNRTGSLLFDRGTASVAIVAAKHDQVDAKGNHAPSYGDEIAVYTQDTAAITRYQPLPPANGVIGFAATALPATFTGGLQQREAEPGAAAGQRRRRQPGGPARRHDPQAHLHPTGGDRRARRAPLPSRDRPEHRRLRDQLRRHLAHGRRHRDRRLGVNRRLGGRAPRGPLHPDRRRGQGDLDRDGHGVDGDGLRPVPVGHLPDRRARGLGGVRDRPLRPVPVPGRLRGAHGRHAHRVAAAQADGAHRRARLLQRRGGRRRPQDRRQGVPARGRPGRELRRLLDRRAAEGQRHPRRAGRSEGGRTGGSAVTLSHTVAADYSDGGALALSYEFSLEATSGGVLAGFSVGATVEHSMTVTSGSSTTYSGTVGSIDGAHFADHYYQYGLFTYVQQDPATRQQFEVLNWWVER